MGETATPRGPGKPHRFHKLGYPGRIIATLAYTAIIWLESPGEWGTARISLLVFIFSWPHLAYFVGRHALPSARGVTYLMLLDRVLMGSLWPLCGYPLVLLCMDLIVASVVGLSSGGLKVLAANLLALAAGVTLGLLLFGLPTALLPPSLPAFLVASLFIAIYCGIIGNAAFTQAVAVAKSRRALKELSQSLEEKVAQRTAELRLANEAFRRFVPAEFLHTLGYEDVARARLGDAIAQDMTVLFADVRDFTGLSEKMGPEQTFAFLNACLSRLGPLVRQFGGFIDKYIGDAIMALFPSGPASAVQAAIAMQRAVTEHNRRHPDEAPLVVGSGIHVGPVMMGMIGEEQRLEATVISDAVNLTARLETLTKQLGCSILITDEVARGLDEGERRATRWLGDFAVKGKADPARLHEVFTADGDVLAAHKAASRERLSAAIELHQRGDLDGAARTFGELCDACPEDGPARWWQAHCQWELASGVVGPRPVVRLREK